MKFQVLGARHDLKVFWSVVLGVFVFVMDKFTRQESAAQKSFHDDTVLGPLGTFYSAIHMSRVPRVPGWCPLVGLERIAILPKAEIVQIAQSSGFAWRLAIRDRAGRIGIMGSLKNRMAYQRIAPSSYPPIMCLTQAMSEVFPIAAHDATQTRHVLIVSLLRHIVKGIT